MKWLLHAALLFLCAWDSNSRFQKNSPRLDAENTHYCFLLSAPGKMGIRPNPWPLFMCCFWETESERRVKRSERENGCIVLEQIRSHFFCFKKCVKTWFRLCMLLDVYCHTTLQKKSTVYAPFFLIGFTISVLSAYSWIMCMCDYCGEYLKE